MLRLLKSVEKSSGREGFNPDARPTPAAAAIGVSDTIWLNFIGEEDVELNAVPPKSRGDVFYDADFAAVDVARGSFLGKPRRSTCDERRRLR